MSWFLLAIFGHLANAAAFVIDKALLARAWKSSATYAALVGGLSVLAFLAMPWVKVWPQGGAIVSAGFFGGLFVFALWAFFEALRRGKASQVVPIVGSLIPLLTLAGTSALLGEHLSSRAGGGFICLILATWLLARGSGVRALDVTTLGVAALSAMLFALTSVAGKQAFAHGDFWGVLVVSRVAAVIVAVVIAVTVQGARTELRRLLSTRASSQASLQGLFGWTMLGQILGALGFLLVNAALARGSAPLVNALQAVQYAVLVLVAWLGGARLRAILQEDISRRTLIVKSLALLLVGMGLWLVVV